MHIENFSAWHNVPIGTQAERHGGHSTPSSRINSPLHVRHVAMLGDMAKKGLFTYAGRTNQAEAKFRERRMRDADLEHRRAGELPAATRSSTGR